MRVIIRSARYGVAGILVPAALLIAGCDGSTGTTAGAIGITVSTEGANLDLETDGYSIILDAGRAQNRRVELVKAG